LTVGEEGGYVNDPRDPGGETKYGISKRAYPDEDIQNLSLERAKELYRRDYWDALGLDGSPWNIAYPLFDCAVNQGPGYAHTLASINDPIELFAQRALRYAQAKNIAYYGRGWFRRLFTVFQNSRILNAQ